MRAAVENLGRGRRWFCTSWLGASRHKTGLSARKRELGWAPVDSTQPTERGSYCMHEGNADNPASL